MQLNFTDSITFHDYFSSWDEVVTKRTVSILNNFTLIVIYIVVLTIGSFSRRLLQTPFWRQLVIAHPLSRDFQSENRK